MHVQLNIKDVFISKSFEIKKTDNKIIKNNQKFKWTDKREEHIHTINHITSHHR